jgi:hypothetical protein
MRNLRLQLHGVVFLTLNFLFLFLIHLKPIVFLDLTQSNNKKHYLPHAIKALVHHSSSIQQGLKWQKRINRSGIPVYQNIQQLTAKGEKSLQKFSWQSQDVTMK